MSIKYSFSNNQFKKQINYVFSVIEQILGIDFNKDYSDLVITYGQKLNRLQNRHQIHIYQSNYLFNKENYLEKDSFPILPLDSIKLNKFKVIDTMKFTQDDLPILYRRNNKPTIEIKDDSSFKLIEVNVDIIASIFFMLSRYEEYVVDEEILDIHNRFPAKESIAYKEDFLSRPIVNEYIELLWQFIDWFDLGYKKKNRWNNNSFAACLTHDVDFIQKYNGVKSLIKPILKNVIKKLDFKKSSRNILDYYKSEKNYENDPYWTFEYIIESESKYNFNSSFYFMTSNIHKYDGDYNFKSNKIRNLIQKLEEQNFEVGIHPNYNSYNNFSVMKDQVESLRNILQNQDFGVRQHYLRFDIQQTWNLHNRNNLLYDTTLSFADYAGFRCGICHPFKIYSLSQDKVLDLWEIPLNVMEVTLRNPDYMDLSPQQAYDYVTNLIDKISHYNGLFTLLWHNNNFSGDWQEWQTIYEGILSYIDKKNGRGMSGRGIIKEWIN